MPKAEPAHGYCALCNGPIPKGVMWTLTGQMHRVHADRDDCIAVLQPKLYKEFIKLNPTYRSGDRYDSRRVHDKTVV